MAEATIATIDGDAAFIWSVVALLRRGCKPSECNLHTGDAGPDNRDSLPDRVGRRGGQCLR